MAPLRREQIVRATIRCLAREGYTRLTMKKVAREAGVSQGILHYYFADKRAMLVATLATVSRDLDRRVAAAQSHTTRDPAARLRALVRACLEVAVRRPEFWVVFLEFWGEMVHDRRLREVNAEVYARTRRLIARLITEGVRADVPADRAGVRTLADDWSAQEIVDHLLETFRPGVDELRCLLADVRPPGDPIPAALQSKAPALRPWSWLRDELRRTQADVLD